MREPSIHITKSQFEEILNTLEVDNFPVEAFFVIARKEAINHRAVLVSNNKNTMRVIPENGQIVKSLQKYVIPFVKILNLIPGKVLLNTLRLG